MESVADELKERESSWPQSTPGSRQSVSNIARVTVTGTIASWFPEHIGKNPTAVLYTDGSQTVGTDATLAISFVLPAR